MRRVRPQPNTHPTLLGPVIVALAVIASGCLSACEDAAVASPARATGPVDGTEDGRDRRVRFEAVTPATTETLAVLPAEVVVPPHATQAVGPAIAGRLTAWLVSPGDRVEVGTPLARLESLEFADLEARRAELEGTVKQRRRLLNRRRQHVAAGVDTEQALLDAEGALAADQAALTALEQQLSARRRLRSGPGAATESDSPADDRGTAWTWSSSVRGLVSAVTCPPGSLQDAGAECVTIVDDGLALVRVRIPERHIARAGGEATLVLASDPGERPIPLTLVRREGALSRDSRTLAHDYAPKGEAALRIGSTGRVAITAPAPAGTVRVKRASVTRMAGEDVVFVPGDGPGGGVPLVIRIAGRVDDDLLVSSAALNAESKVAVHGLFLLKSLALVEAE